jgi:hypothetical protein
MLIYFKKIVSVRDSQLGLAQLSPKYIPFVRCSPKIKINGDWHWMGN